MFNGAKTPSSWGDFRARMRIRGGIMPVQKVIKNGKTMYRWGDSGKLYSTKKEAISQGIAIMLSQKRRGEEIK